MATALRTKGVAANDSKDSTDSTVKERAKLDRNSLAALLASEPGSIITVINVRGSVS